MTFICSECGADLLVEQSPETMIIHTCPCIHNKLDDMEADLNLVKSVIEGLR